MSERPWGTTHPTNPPDFLAVTWDAGTQDTFEVNTTYDVAGRPISVSFTNQMKQTATFDRGGNLATVTVTPDLDVPGTTEPILTNTSYNARGQLVSCTYGNNVVTERTYDTALERLLRVFTQLPGSPDSRLQDLRYHYDPVGNPMRIVDKLRGDAYAHNTLVPNTRSFTYDPRYRLTRAIGGRNRQFAGPYTLPHPSPSTSSKNDRERYDLRYDYDEVGNFRRNQELTKGWLHYKADRIDLYNGTGREAIDDDPTAGNWQYDDNGNCTKTPQHGAIAYGFDNQPVFVNMGGDTVVRDLRFGDQRSVRLLKKNGAYKVSLYIGPFEVHRRVGTGDSYTKVTLQVSGVGRMAQVERVLAGSDSNSTALFFVHSDHLGSGHVLTDGSGDLLSQEEHLPYGKTADPRWERNRYRYLGVETDEETGLTMTGPRTLMTSVGRFLQPDPIRKAGVSPWVYASGNPIGRADPSGYIDDESLNGAADVAARDVTPSPEPSHEVVASLNDTSVAKGSDGLYVGEFSESETTISGGPDAGEADYAGTVEGLAMGLGQLYSDYTVPGRMNQAVNGVVGVAENNSSTYREYSHWVHGGIAAAFDSDLGKAASSAAVIAGDAGALVKAAGFVRTFRGGPLATSSMGAGRGASRLGGTYQTTKNKNDGTLWLSNGTIEQDDFVETLNMGRLRASMDEGYRVKILTGVHGNSDGTTIKHTKFFNEDLAGSENLIM